MEPDEEDVFSSLCNNSERLMKEMNVFLASISNNPDVSIKTTSGMVAPEDDDEGQGNANRNKLPDSATGGETDDDSLVAMARQMDSASIISDPLEKGYHAHVPLSPRMEISAGMEAMLAQFTNSDPSIKKETLSETFNNSDPSIKARALRTQTAPPFRSYPKQIEMHSPLPPPSPITATFSKTNLLDKNLPATNILPFPIFENIHQRRRLSLGRMSDVDVRAATNALLQEERKSNKSASKGKDADRGKDYIFPAKHAISPLSQAKRESAEVKTTDASRLRKKTGWHKKQLHNQNRDSDDEMCGVGINTRVHDEKQNKSKSSKEKRHRHNMEKRQHQSESKSTSNTQRRPTGKSSSRTGVEQSGELKSHSEERRNHKTHRRMRTIQSGNNLDTERIQHRSKSSSPKTPRRLSNKSSSGDNSAYDSDNETQFFYESTDADDEDVDESEDEMKAVGTSVVDAVKDLNERSAVAKVKNLFKLHH